MYGFRTCTDYRNMETEAESGKASDVPVKKSYSEALNHEVNEPNQENNKRNSPESVKASTKQPPLTPGQAKIARIPSPTNNEKKQIAKMAIQRENTRMKNPPLAVRMTTVSMTARLVQGH